ncbi:MAG: hypothetical protein R3C24_13875 [Cyanobacteriota/Melainabacteria group bacterium]|nr:hypothetical protein [Cyanobacteria bacterium HKST-UBA01]MCB9470993.1 hypothetical protein [Candidatus Obscuribacterales bacterium]
MNDEVLTADERRCLRMWFRQAIAQAEQQDVAATLYNEHYGNEAESDTPATHRHTVARRRSRKGRMIPHLREMVF